MTVNEVDLMDALKSDNDEKVIQAAISLCREFLFPSHKYSEAEFILLEAIGRQSNQDGYIIQLLLAELYINIGEISRAKRFLAQASKSSNEDVKKKADELQLSIRD